MPFVISFDSPAISGGAAAYAGQADAQRQQQQIALQQRQLNIENAQRQQQIRFEQERQVAMYHDQREREAFDRWWTQQQAQQNQQYRNATMEQRDRTVDAANQRNLQTIQSREGIADANNLSRQTIADANNSSRQEIAGQRIEFDRKKLDDLNVWRSQQHDVALQRLDQARDQAMASAQNDQQRLEVQRQYYNSLNSYREQEQARRAMLAEREEKADELRTLQAGFIPPNSEKARRVVELKKWLEANRIATPQQATSPSSASLPASPPAGPTPAGPPQTARAVAAPPPAPQQNGFVVTKSAYDEAASKEERDGNADEGAVIDSLIAQGYTTMPDGTPIRQFRENRIEQKVQERIPLTRADLLYIGKKFNGNIEGAVQWLRQLGYDERGQPLGGS